MGNFRKTKKKVKTPIFSFKYGKNKFKFFFKNVSLIIRLVK